MIEKNQMKTIIALLLDDSIDEDERVEAIEELISPQNWPLLEQALFDVLENENEEYWSIALQLFWGAILDKRPLNAHRVIALAYLRLKPDKGSTESNFAWSIACTIKQVSYLSDYDPLKDPAIMAIMDQLKQS